MRNQRTSTGWSLYFMEQLPSIRAAMANGEGLTEEERKFIGINGGHYTSTHGHRKRITPLIILSNRWRSLTEEDKKAWCERAAAIRAAAKAAASLGGQEEPK